MSAAPLPTRWRAAALVVGAGYALGAATTTPFSLAANVVTAIPLLAVVVAAVVRWPARPRPLVLPPPERSSHPYRPWAALVAAVVAWELVMYLAPGSRGAHPTLSSMIDAANRQYPAKAAIFFAWLYLGAAIVRRGTPSPVPATEAKKQ